MNIYIIIYMCVYIYIYTHTIYMNAAANDQRPI